MKDFLVCCFGNGSKPSNVPPASSTKKPLYTESGTENSIFLNPDVKNSRGLLT